VSESVAQSAGIPQDYFGSDQSEPSPYPYVSYSNTTVPNGPAPDKAGVQSLDPISVRVQKPSFLQNLGEDILGAADVGKTLVGGTLGMVPGTAEFLAKALAGDNSKSAQDLYAESLAHYTPDLLTQRGKEMGGDLMSFMERNKIPLAIPELMPFEEALGSGAGAAMRKSDEALKAITPKHGEFGSNLGNLSYRGSHTAPGPDFGAPLHDLTGGGEMYPANVYGPNAVQYYGTGFPKLDKEVFDLAKRVKGKPDAEVTVYRAVPNDENITDINKGDWVTLSKDYAKNHGESVLDNDYKILSKKAKAKELYTNADSIHEFGYQPEELTPEQRLANFEAFKAASVDPRQYYHGSVHNPNPAFGETVKDMNDLIASGGITQFRGNPKSGMTFVSPDPQFAERYAGIDEFGRPQKSQIFGMQRGAMYPVHVQVKKPFDYENPSQVNDLVKEIGDPSNIINDVWKGGTEKMPEEFKHELTHALISNGDWSFLEHPDAISAAKRLGHDAMYIKEKKTKNLGVFDPNVIKSSIANRGTYDITEPHMSKAQGGAV